MMRPGVQQMPGASQEQAPKVSITMYIGNLPSSVSDDFIQVRRERAYMPAWRQRGAHCLHPPNCSLDRLSADACCSTLRMLKPQELIGACGTVRSWKRLQDPDTGKLKNFGFVEYASVEDLIR